MTQLSLLETSYQLAGAMAAIRAAMRATVGAPESEGRKALPDRMNAIARQAGVRLTQGNQKNISKDTLDKWLSPADTTHTPSLMAVLIFCAATENMEPLRAAAKSLGLDLMTKEDMKFRDYGRAVWEMKAARERKRKLENDL
ncbi:hypothetical protein [Desulfovibrio sp. SGI.169]|uniref:hypothetical protein n=1 Tax=Desulfovibrio sp. SGI.169 TaxID=3420561 RepID=UPI003CFFC396